MEAETSVASRVYHQRLAFFSGAPSLAISDASELARLSVAGLGPPARARIEGAAQISPPVCLPRGRGAELSRRRAVWAGFRMTPSLRLARPSRVALVPLKPGPGRESPKPTGPAVRTAMMSLCACGCQCCHVADCAQRPPASATRSCCHASASVSLRARWGGAHVGQNGVLLLDRQRQLDMAEEATTKSRKLALREMFLRSCGVTCLTSAVTVCLTSTPKRAHWQCQCGARHKNEKIGRMSVESKMPFGNPQCFV